MRKQLTAVGHTFSSHDPAVVTPDIETAFSNALLYAQRSADTVLSKLPFDVNEYVFQLTNALEPIAWQMEAEPIIEHVSINYMKTRIPGPVTLADLAVTAVNASDVLYARELKAILAVLQGAGVGTLSTFMQFWWGHAFRGSLQQQGMSIGPLSTVDGSPYFKLYTYSFSARITDQRCSDWRSMFVPVLYDVDFSARWHTYRGDLNVWDSVHGTVETQLGGMIGDHIRSVPIDI